MNKKSLSLILAVLCFSMTGCAGSRTSLQKDSFDKGVAALDKGEYKKATDLFNKALSYSSARVGKEEISISEYKSISQLLSGDSDAAYKTVSNLIYYKDDDPSFYYLRGAVSTAGDADKAEADFKKAVSFDKEDYDMFFAVYDQLVKAGKTDQAGKYLKKVIAIDKNTGEFFNAKGKASYLLSDYDTAEDYFSKAVKAGYYEAYLGLARVSAKKNDSDAAKKRIGLFVSKAEKTQENYTDAAEAYLSIGQYKDCQKAVTEGLKLKGDSTGRLKRCEIISCEYQGDFTKAEKLAVEYLKLYPDDSDMAREEEILKTRI